MTEVFRNWLLGVTAAALLASVAGTLMPAGPVKKASKLICGLIILLAVVKPVLSLDVEALAEYKVQWRNVNEEYAANINEVDKRLARVIIEEETAAYILDKAADMDVRVTVTCRFFEDENWYPYSVEIAGSFTEDQKEKLTQVIENDLAIPRDRQSWVAEDNG
jgi:stage III sporulation protein AF